MRAQPPSTKNHEMFCGLVKVKELSDQDPGQMKKIILLMMTKTWIQICGTPISQLQRRFIQFNCNTAREEEVFTPSLSMK